MSLKKTGIKSVKDLAGKKVGVPSGSSQTTMLPLLLKSNNLKESDINMIDMPVASMVPALLQGQVDAVLGSIDAYQIQAEAQGAQLDVYRFADHGVPTVSTSIFASNSYLKENPDVVKKFIAASLKGWSFALDNPDKAIKDLKVVFPEVNEKLAAAELAAITPLFCSGGAQVHRQGGGRAVDEVAGRCSSEVKLLPAGQDPKTYYTNEYLPPRRRCVPASRRAVVEARRDEPMRRQARVHAMPISTSGMAFRSPGRTITDADLVGLRRADRRLLGAAHERRLREEQPVRAPGRARHARARLRARPHVGAHRRAARDGDRLSRHQRLAVRRARSSSATRSS